MQADKLSLLKRMHHELAEEDETARCATLLRFSFLSFFLSFRADIAEFSRVTLLLHAKPCACRIALAFTQFKWVRVCEFPTCHVCDTHANMKSVVSMHAHLCTAHWDA